MADILLPNQLSGTSRHGSSLGFITRTGALYLGPHLKTSIHALHNYKIYIAINGDFDLLMEGGQHFSSCKTVIIAPDQPHKLVSRDVQVAAFYLVPETDAGRMLSAHCSGRAVFAPPAGVLAAITPQLRKYLEQGCSVEEADALCEYLFKKLTPPTNPNLPLDLRIGRALNYLDAEVGNRVTIADVASEVALSRSHLEHLFSEQVGIPISRYVLWTRIRGALMLMAGGKLLTEVAYDVGFSDSAHLSRTFRRMIGIAPSTLLRQTSLYGGNSEPEQIAPPHLSI